MITVRVKKIQIPDKFKNLSKRLPSYITKYMYEHIDSSLDSAIKRIRDNYVYKKLTRDTGKLGRSMTPYKRRVSPTSLEYGLWFDTRIAPHAATQIPENDRGLTIIKSKGKKLTIPIKGGPADVKGRRLIAAGMGLTAKRGILYKGEVPYFTLKTSVTVPQRIYRSTIREYLTDPVVGNMQGAINRIGKQAIKAAQRDKII